MAEEFCQRIGIDRSANTYPKYNVAYKNLKRFLKEKYHIEDIPLTQLDLPFIEDFNFYLRVECGLMPGSAITSIIYLQKVARIALHRNLISRPPFVGYKPEKPEIKKLYALTSEGRKYSFNMPLKKTVKIGKREYNIELREEDGSEWVFG